MHLNKGLPIYTVKHTVPIKCKLTVSTRNSKLDPRCFSSFENHRVSSFVTLEDLPIFTVPHMYRRISADVTFNNKPFQFQTPQIL